MSAPTRPREAAVQARIFKALHEVALAASGVLDPVELAGLAVDHARDLVAAWSATLIWFESEDRLTVLADNHPVGFPSIGLAPGRGMSGQVKSTGSVVVVDDYPAWEHAFPWAVEGGVRSMIGVPLKVQDRAVGCLLVRSDHPHHFGPDERDVLLLLAAQVAPAMETAALTAEREKSARIFEALHGLAVAASGVLEPRELARIAVERCREMLQVDGTVIFRFDPRQGLLRQLNETSVGMVDDIIEPGEGAIGLAFSNRRAYAIGNYLDWPNRLEAPANRGLAACMSQPLIAGDRAIGVIGTWSMERREWSERETVILSLVAAQVGPALERAIVAEERERQAETLRALNEVAVAAAGILERAELARIATQHAASLLKADGGSITWYDEEEQGLRVLAESQTSFDPGRVVPVSEAGAVGLAYATGEPVAVPDYATWPARIAAEVDQVASALVVPLLVRQRRIGTLGVSFVSRHEILPADVQLLTLLAAEVAPSLEAARLYEDLRESEGRKSSILESAIDCMIAADDTGRIIEFNPAAERTFGHRREQVLGKLVWEVIVPQRLRGADLEQLSAFVETNRVSPGRRFETIGLRADGSEFPLELSIAGFKKDGKTMFSASIRDLTERQAAETIRLESEAKSRFVAAMSHELRTPLNSILGFSQLLAGSTTGDLTDRQMRYVGHIESSGRHLLALINDVLDLSKVEAGQMEVEVEPIELYPLLEEAINQVRPLADSKSIDLLVDVISPIWIRADRRRFLQVLLNLLSNAIKFTPRTGLIRVGAAKAGRLAEVRVTDTGIGIPATEQQRIFEEFTQVERPTHEHSEGTGLGLALSRRLLQIMRGSIRVESEVGVGSTFVVTIPRIRPGEVADARPLLLVVHGRDEDPGLLTQLELGPYRVIAAETVREAAVISRRRRLAGIVVGVDIAPADEDWLREALRDHPRTNSLPILSATVALHPGVLIRD